MRAKRLAFIRRAARHSKPFLHYRLKVACGRESQASSGGTTACCHADAILNRQAVGREHRAGQKRALCAGLAVMRPSYFSHLMRGIGHLLVP